MLPNTFSDSLLPLTKELKEIGILSGITSLLHWDQETYMPSNAIHSRSDQLALMSKLVHSRVTSSKFKDELGKLINLNSSDIKQEKLTQFEKKLVKEVYKDWKKSVVLPSEFVEAFSKATSEAQHQWQFARKENNFEKFAPHLDKLIKLSKEKAEYIGYEHCVYDTLLDDYEADLTSDKLTPLFDELKVKLSSLLKDVLKKQGKSPIDFSSIIFDEKKQWEFGERILAKMNYDFTRGRQDKSTHPFSIHFHPDDVRITTRFDEHDFMESFSSTIHEGGHALYEQGLSTFYFGTPLGEATSLGIHESQSRLWENWICKSASFWKGHYSELQQLFSKELGSYSWKEFYDSINMVKPSFIRVESDELTYNLHILIRYEIEQLMFNSQVDVNELPKIWNDLYEKYLGIRPKTHSEGILQDVHWAGGSFGYFPTYTLGNLYAAQMYEKIKLDINNIDTVIENGELNKIKVWLNDHVHQYGRLYSGEELISQISGSSLKIEPFMTYLNQKYLG